MQYLKCTKCLEEKPIDCFTKRPTRPKGYYSSCKKCRARQSYEWFVKTREANPELIKQDSLKKKNASIKKYGSIDNVRTVARERGRERYQKMKDYKNQYLFSHPCVDCGETDIEILSFDHVRGEKKFNVSTLLTNSSDKNINLLNEEIEKCDVRCLNCHRLIERERRKDRLYCYVNNIEYIPPNFVSKENFIETTNLGTLYYRANKEYYSQVKFLKKKEYFDKYLPEYVNFLNVGCLDCGLLNPLVMEFDHLPQYEKINILSKLFFNEQRPWEEILHEVSKCEIVCANCHQKRTNYRNKHHQYNLRKRQENKPKLKREIWKRKLKLTDLPMIENLIIEGKLLWEIAKKFNIQTTTLSNFINDYGSPGIHEFITKNIKNNKILNANSKLSKQDVLEIKVKLLNKESQASIARHYDVSEGTIAGIYHNRTWAHVIINDGKNKC